MSKTVVMYITSKVIFRVNDPALTDYELFENLDYSFDMDFATGAEVIDTELVDFEVKAAV